MTPISLRTAAALSVLGALLAGCSADSEAGTSTSPASASATQDPSPSTTLTPEEQQAVEEATAVVLAREQLFFDLLADPSRSLNEMNSVVTEPQLAIDLADLGELTSLVAGGTLVVESSGPVAIRDATATKVDLRAPGVVELEVCLDRTQTQVSSDGRPWDNSSELAKYTLVKTDYLPGPGWAVTRVLPPDGHSQPQPC